MIAGLIIVLAAVYFVIATLGWMLRLSVQLTGTLMVGTSVIAFILLGFVAIRYLTQRGKRA